MSFKRPKKKKSLVFFFPICCLLKWILSLDVDDSIRYGHLLNYHKYCFSANKDIANPLWPLLAKWDSGTSTLSEASVCNRSESSVYEKVQWGVSSFLMSTLHLSCCPVTCFDSVSFGANHLSGKKKARSEIMTISWPRERIKYIYFNILQTWGRKTRWCFLRNWWSKENSQAVIFSNVIIVDYGISPILKLSHLNKLSCRNKSSFTSPKEMIVNVIWNHRLFKCQALVVEGLQVIFMLNSIFFLPRKWCT